MDTTISTSDAAGTTAAVTTTTARWYLAAAALWTVSVAWETLFAHQDTPADGPSFWINEAFAYAAMTCLVTAVWRSGTEGLAGSSRAGRIWLRAMAVCWVLIMIGALLMNALNLKPAVALVVVGGAGRMLAELVAGLVVARRGPTPLPGRAVFAVYGVSMAIVSIVSPDGPGHPAEFAMGALWALIGLSARPITPRLNRGCAAAAVACAALAVTAALVS